MVRQHTIYMKNKSFQRECVNNVTVQTCSHGQTFQDSGCGWPVHRLPLSFITHWPHHPALCQAPVGTASVAVCQHAHIIWSWWRCGTDTSSQMLSCRGGALRVNPFKGLESQHAAWCVAPGFLQQKYLWIGNVKTLCEDAGMWSAENSK